jgi:hypothetical protein
MGGLVFRYDDILIPWGTCGFFAMALPCSALFILVYAKCLGSFLHVGAQQPSYQMVTLLSPVEGLGSYNVYRAYDRLREEGIHEGARICSTNFLHCFLQVYRRFCARIGVRICDCKSAPI